MPMSTLQMILALLVGVFPAGEAGHMAAVADDPAVFSCAPQRISPGDRLLLRKHSALLVELAVLRPGEPVAHVLVVGSPPDDMHPLMSTESFSTAEDTWLEVDSLTGMPWRSGAAQEPVFTVAGEYRILVSTALESEEGAYACTVTFSGRAQSR